VAHPLLGRLTACRDRYDYAGNGIAERPSAVVDDVAMAEVKIGREVTGHTAGSQINCRVGMI
jgi:hypothetical protein